MLCCVEYPRISPPEICLSCGSIAVVASHPLFQGGLCKKCKVRYMYIHACMQAYTYASMYAHMHTYTNKHTHRCMYRIKNIVNVMFYNFMYLPLCAKCFVLHRRTSWSVYTCLMMMDHK